MGEIGRPQLAVYVAAAIAIALVGARYLREQGGGSPGSASAAPAAGVRVEKADGQPAVVDVAGAVREPGVYRLPASARVDDAVREAGGPKGNADLAGLNLAAKVEDGRQYIVPAKVSAAAAGGGGGGPPAEGDPAVAGVAAAPTPSTPLNLNTATAEQLDQLDGVGPETARKIVAYRDQKGGFRSIEELDQVPGIGPQRLAALRDLVRV